MGIPSTRFCHLDFGSTILDKRTGLTRSRWNLILAAFSLEMIFTGVDCVELDSWALPCGCGIMVNSSILCLYEGSAVSDDELSSHSLHKTHLLHQDSYPTL